MQKQPNFPPWALLAGDALVLLAVTIVGFENHNENLAGWRWLTSFLPLVISWGLVAPWLGNYDPDLWRSPVQAWRALLAMVLAGPMAGFLRAVMLNGVIIPIFVVVLGGISALALTAWRVIWSLLAARNYAWTKPR